MRKILCKGKIIGNDSWVEGYLYPGIGLDKGKWFITVVDTSLMHSETYCVNPETVGQYIGLLDRAKNEIFEGDIVKHYIKNSEFVKTYIVEWDSRLAKFVGRYTGDKYYGKKYAYAELHEDLTYEIIGNIHDNPEICKEAL